MRGFQFGKGLRHCCYKGGGGSGGSGKGKGGGGGAESAQSDLPQGVTVEKFDETTSYVFDVAGEDIRLNIEEGFTVSLNSSRPAALVDFTVSDLYGKTGSLEGRDALKAAFTLKRSMQYDVSRRPDGFIYKASAFTKDGYGDERTKAYTKIGFSAPSKTGDFQYAIVRNGKLQPYTPRN